MTTETKVSGVPAYTGTDPELKSIFAALTALVSTREGTAGNADDRYLTPRLCKSLSVQFNNVIVENGWSGWVDDGNWRMTIENGIITNVSASSGAGYQAT